MFTYIFLLPALGFLLNRLKNHGTPLALGQAVFHNRKINRA